MGTCLDGDPNYCPCSIHVRLRQARCHCILFRSKLKDAYERLENIRDGILGPTVPDCCDGGRAEVEMAIYEITEILKILDCDK